MSDKTNFVQSLMHMIKGNLGTGILAMPISFKHAGLLTSAIGLPIICVIATFCVHLLVRSSQHLETKMKWTNLDYAALAKASFKAGPSWLRRLSGLMCRLVDAILIISQLGICCVYLVFIVDNIQSILKPINDEAQPDETPSSTTEAALLRVPSDATRRDHPASYEPISKPMLFICILPFILIVSYVRTLKRLSLASACANLLQAMGILITIYLLIKNMPTEPRVQAVETDLREVALGFGSAMFAFEGISVVLPVYLRMRRPEQMGGCCGLINLSYSVLLVLYAAIGVLGYLCYGDLVGDAITLNLPQGTLSNIVRGFFATSIFLTYPLQFYVPNEIIWGWFKDRIFPDPELPVTSTTTVAATSATTSTTMSPVERSLKESKSARRSNELNFEYLFRTLLVLFTFALAITVPYLNLLMDLVGSISGTALSITLPAIIHLATFWDDVSGRSKTLMVTIDCALIFVSVIASASGTYASLRAILRHVEPSNHQLNLAH